MFTATNSATKQSIISGIRISLIILWMYAATAKLANFDQSRTEMLEQVFPPMLAEMLAWMVPLTEFLTAALLILPQTIRYGLRASLTMLAIFTGYIMLVMMNVFDHIPCSCGGILQNMNWAEHLVFNVFFIYLAATAIILAPKERRTMGKA